MNRRKQIKQKRSSYAWNYMEASKLWKGKLLTAKGLQRIAKVLRATLGQTTDMLQKAGR